MLPIRYSVAGFTLVFATGNAVRLAAVLALAATCATCPNPADAHGFAGKRFFPATLGTEDPFVADELSLPTVAGRKLAASGDSPATMESNVSLEWAKRITPNFGFMLGTAHRRLKSDAGDAVAGFDNLGVGFKYQFYKNDERETIVSAGVDIDIGGSGARRIGAERFSTIAPTLFFGKGFGDLPEALKYLRPLALTGLAGIAMPTRSSTTIVDDAGDATIERHPNVLRWGFAAQYSLPYLQSFVKDIGLSEPFNRLIPVVEFALQTPIDRGGGGTTGTVNPGFIWTGRTVQLGLEAVIPVNGRTGGGTGLIAQVHWYLDDLFPRSIGRPVFGR